MVRQRACEKETTTGNLSASAMPAGKCVSCGRLSAQGNLLPGRSARALSMSAPRRWRTGESITRGRGHHSPGRYHAHTLAHARNVNFSFIIHTGEGHCCAHTCWQITLDTYKQPYVRRTHTRSLNVCWIFIRRLFVTDRGGVQSHSNQRWLALWVCLRECVCLCVARRLRECCSVIGKTPIWRNDESGPAAFPSMNVLNCTAMWLKPLPLYSSLPRSHAYFMCVSVHTAAVYPWCMPL